MTSIKVTAAGYEVELDIPDDSQVMHALRYETMLTITAEAFQSVANAPSSPGPGSAQRANQLTALAALQAAIDAARDAALPGLTLTPE